MPARKLTADTYRTRRIKAAMVGAGYNQRQLAKKLGIGEDVLSRRLKDPFSMKVCDLILMCRVIKLDPKEILEVEAS